MTPRVAAPLRRTPEDDYSRAFAEYLRVGAVEDAHAIELLEEDDQRLLEEQRVLSKAASGGGFLCPTSTADQMLSAIRAAGPIGQLAREFRTTGGETFNAPLDSTHGTAAWTAESGSYTPSDETITQLQLSAYKSTSKIIVSEELLQDSAVDLEAALALELGTRMGVLQETAYISGDGSGKPTGILDAASAVGVTTAATGSTTNFTPADLASAFKALGAGYRSNASWVMNPDLFANLATRTDSQGALVFPSLGFDPPSVLGRRVYLSPDLPSPAASAKSVIVGDFSVGYAIRRVTSMGMQRQLETHSDSGQMGLRAFSRVDGKVAIASALRILQNSAT